MKDLKDWNLKGKRFVSFLDIMGFKDMIIRKKPMEIYGDLKSISNIRNQIDNLDAEDLDVNITTISFSDSIILFTETDKLKDFKVISLATNFLTAYSMHNDIPIKGAISHGEMTLDFTNQIFFGQPLVDSYNLQEDIKFYGILAHNSVEPFIKKTRLEKRIKDSYFDCKSPMKYGNVSHYVLDWFSIDIADDKASPKERIEKLMTRHRNNVSGEPRKYVDNTLILLKEITQHLTPAS